MAQKAGDMKPRRSVLSVPGHVAKMHRKAAASAADVLMLDLEDSVPIDRKEAARRQVIESLLSLDWQGKTLTVRMNSLDTPFGYRDVIDLAEKAGERLDAIVIPKANGPEEVHCVSRLLDGITLRQGFSNTIGLEPIIETARGMDNISRTAKASPRLKTLVFGIVDYSESIGARLISLSGHGENEADVYPGHRWHFALSRIAMAAKANGLMAIDAPFGNFRDLSGLRGSTRLACALGLDGKWVIHPDQIAVVNEIFSPARADIARAERVIRAHEEAMKNGRGAASIDGSLVDNATIRLARQLYEKARQLGMV